MKAILSYLLFFCIVLIGLLVLAATTIVPQFITDHKLLFLCVIMGGLGGITYCLRAVYLNVCVRKRWDPDWHIWYYLRPVVSLICGGVSYVFLRAGLLILEAERSGHSSDIGFLALAFIAGLNVDKFITKIEDIAQATWGIEQSRVGKGESIDRN